MHAAPKLNNKKTVIGGKSSDCKFSLVTLLHKKRLPVKKLKDFASTKLCVKILPQIVNIHKILQLCIFGFDKIQVKCFSSCPRKDSIHECFTCKYFLNPSGDYNCEAESALGVASVTHHLLVLLGPHPPTPRCERWWAMIIIKIIITSMFFCPRTHLLLGNDHAVHDDDYNNVLDHNGDDVHTRPDDEE